VVCDGARKPLVRLMRDTLPAASTLLADRGYDSNGFRQALEAKSVRPAFRRPKAAKRRSAPLFVSMKAAISQHI
jgi:IS5 family transposase